MSTVLHGKRQAIRTLYNGRRHYGTASAQARAFYNDSSIIDTPLMAPAEYAPVEAAGRRVLEAHDATDLAAMLGLLLVKATPTSSCPTEQGAAA